ncbi:hypothetical protein DFS34DRAFT_596863 [Phlyctochytrium arcticum]|nr:hypothetical protein DFS34DRAFT_596863 [Phlyctochytrium arcticum]
MSIPSVIPSHVFGLNADVHNNLVYVDDQTVLYPAGTQLVSYSTEQKSQKFISVNEGDAITAMAVHAAANMAAVAVRGAHSRRSFDTGKDHSWHSPSFTYIDNDGRYIIAQSSGPDWTLYIWDWDKAKIRGTVKTSNHPNAEVNHMSVNPFDMSNVHVCVTGHTVFRTYKHAEGSWKLMNQHKTDKVKSSPITSWYFFLTPGVVCRICCVTLGTEDGKLLVYDSGELILEITYILPHVATTHLAPPAITEVKHSANGLIAGTSSGVCVMFEKTDDANLYKKGREYVLQEGARVRTIAMSPAEDIAVVTCRNSQLYSIVMDSDAGKGEDVHALPLAQPFHHGSITGMDTCARKPLVATCGLDRSVRIWNYMDNSVEVMKYFDDEPLSISLHPSGLYILVGFTEGLKLMNVLIDDIRQYWEAAIRGCRECHFSNGGQYFAVVHGSTIIIYNTWTLDIVAHLKAHKAKIRSISWSLDDTRLVSCGLDGAVYDWNVRNSKREAEILINGVVFGQAVCTPDGKLVYAVGNDGILREISDGHVFREFSTKVPLMNIYLKISLTLGNSARVKERENVFRQAPGAARSIRALKYPFPQDSPYDFTELTLHNSTVTRMRMAYDDQFLFTCGEDGCLWVYRLQERDLRGTKREKDSSFSDEILVTKSDLKQNFKLQAELKRKVEDLKADNELQLRMKDQNYSHRLKELKEKYANEVEGLKRTIGTLQNDHSANGLRHTQEMENTKLAQENELKVGVMNSDCGSCMLLTVFDTQELQSAFTSKFEDVTEKYEGMQHRSEELKQQWGKQMRDMDATHQEQVKAINDYFKERIKEKVDTMAQLKKQAQAALHAHTATLYDVSQDSDAEILHLSYSYETKLKTERDALASIKAENAHMHSKFDSLTREVDEQKTDLARRISEERRLQGIIRTLERDILGVKREIQERDDTIQDKAKRIYDLKKKNQELEKFKFVLDYKIIELRKQVEPREEDIIVLSKQIKEMDDELNGYHQKHDELGRTIQDLLMRLRAVQNDGKAEAWKCKQGKVTLTAITKDVQDISAKGSDLASLKRQLIAVHHKHQSRAQTPTPPPAPAAEPLINLLRPMTPPPPPGPLPSEDDIANEAQRDHLERTVNTLNERCQKEAKRRLEENMRMCKENTVLLSEINLLRKDIQNSLGRTKQLSGILDSPSKTLTAAEKEILDPPNSNLRHILGKKKRTTLSMPAAMRLLKGGVASLASFPPIV